LLFNPREPLFDRLIGHGLPELSFPQCLSSTSDRVIPLVCFRVVMTTEGAMKALTLLTAAALLFLSVASSYAQYTGPFYGKGKAPPPPAPVATKG
jgi:hypothetical protein